MLLAFILAAVQERGLTFGEDSSTVPEGRLRTAAGFSVQRQPDGSALVRGPFLKADMGLSDWAELGVEWEMRALFDSPDFDDGVGTGDPVWRLKAVPFRRDGWAVGGLLAFKVPSAPEFHGMGTDSADAHFRLFATKEWDWLTAGVTLGLAVLGDRDERDVDPMFVWSAWARARLDGWTLALELRGAQGPRSSDTIGEGVFGDDWISARFGASGRFGRWEVGLAVEAGLTSESPDVQVLAYVSRDWELFDPWEPMKVHWVPLATRSAEAGASFLGLNFDLVRQADGSRLETFRTTAVLGLGPRSDLRVSGDVRALDSGSDAYGLGDLFAEVRWIPFRWGDVTLGGLFGGKTPLQGSAKRLTSGLVDLYGRLVASWRPGAFALHANLGVAINGSPFKAGEQLDSLLWGLAAEYRFTPDLAVFLECEGSSGRRTIFHVGEGWAGRMVQIRAAAQAWLCTVGVAAGLNDHSPEWQFDLGFVFRL